MILKILVCITGLLSPDGQVAFSFTLRVIGEVYVVGPTGNINTNEFLDMYT